MSYSAEDVLVGAMLSDDMVRATVIDAGIGPDDFEHRPLRDLVTTMQEMDDLGYPIEAVSVEAHAVRQGRDVSAEQITTLRELVLSMPHVIGAAQYYADVVAENARRRRAVAAAQQVISRLQTDPHLDVENELAHALMLAQKPPRGARGGWIADLIPDFADRIQGNWDESIPETWLATGFPGIDAMVRGGIRRGELVVVGARPGAGKTVMATNLAINMARQGHRVAIFSAEMTADAILRRASAGFTNTPATLIDTRGGAGHPKLEIKRDAYMHQLRNELPRLPIYVDDTTAPTVAYMHDRVKRLGEIDAVIFDYIGLGGDQAERNGSQEQRISKISRGLATIAKECNVAVVALSQLSRQVESRPPFVPTLSDLRDSGSIEQDAHIVMLLYRRRYYVDLGRLDDDGEPDIMQVHIAKNRESVTGVTRLRFDGPTFSLAGY